jgi:hypothetical protein
MRPVPPSSTTVPVTTAAASTSSTMSMHRAVEPSSNVHGRASSSEKRLSIGIPAGQSIHTRSGPFEYAPAPSRS